MIYPSRYIPDLVRTSAALVLCSAVLVAGASGAAWAVDEEIPQPLKVASFDFKPISYPEDGIAKGIHADMMRELMAEAGLTFTVTFTPPGRIYNELTRSSGTVEVWRSARIEKAVELGLPVLPTIFLPLPLMLFGLAGNKPPKITELTAQPLISILGYSFGGEADRLQARVPGMQILYTNGHTAAFRMLKAGRAKYVLDYWHPGIVTAQEQGIGDVAYTEVFSFPTILWVSKKMPLAQQLIKRLSAASIRILERRRATEKINEAGK